VFLLSHTRSLDVFQKPTTNGRLQGADSKAMPGRPQTQAESLDVFEEPAISSRLQYPDTDAIPERPQTRARCPHAFPEPTISGRLQGVDVSAFPDTGAATNYISLPYTQHHGLVINKNDPEECQSRRRLSDQHCWHCDTAILFRRGNEKARPDFPRLAQQRTRYRPRQPVFARDRNFHTLRTSCGT
jgi:hypothetical protein